MVLKEASYSQVLSLSLYKRFPLLELERWLPSLRIYSMAVINVADIWRFSA